MGNVALIALYAGTSLQAHLAGSLVRLILRAQGKTKEADAEDQKAKELGAKNPD